MNYLDDAERNLLAEWPLDGGMAKIFSVDREGIDEESEESDAYELIWIDSGNVRRHGTLVDMAYGRFDNGLTEEDDNLLKTCPDQALVGNIKNYVGE